MLLQTALEPVAPAPKNTVNLASPQRTKRILHGEATGGGRKLGHIRLFNVRSKFSATQSKDWIVNAVSELATNPASKWIQQTWEPESLFTKDGDPVKFKIEGMLDGVNIGVIVPRR